MNKKTHTILDNAELDAILDFAYGSGSRRQATRERNNAVRTLVSKTEAANEAQAKSKAAA